MQVLVTGASGYIGSGLAHALADRGITVHALIRSMSASGKLRHPFIRVFQGDILDRKSISNAIYGCEQVYHTAGMVKVCARDPSQLYLNNVTGTENMLMEALNHGVTKFLYTSTCGVWGPTGDHVFTEKYSRIAGYDNDYEVSKIIAEKRIREFDEKGIHTVIVNPTKVYGFANDKDAVHYNAQLKKWIQGRLILLPWHTASESNFVFIKDVINGHILAMEKGRRGENYILGGHNISLKHLCATVSSLSKCKKTIIRLPQWMLGAWSIYEVLRSKITKEDPRITPALIPRLSQHAKYSSRAAIEELGYTITPFEESLKKTISDVRKYHVFQE